MGWSVESLTVVPFSSSISVFGHDKNRDQTYGDSIALVKDKENWL